MVKWQEVRGIKPTSADALVSAACRYMNASEYPDINTMAAIIGLEQIEVEEAKDCDIREYEDGELPCT